MKSFLITFTLQGDGSYDHFVNQIRSYGKWARITPYTWIVISDRRASEIRTELQEAVDGDCTVFVIEVTSSPWASYRINKDVADWLKDNI